MAIKMTKSSTYNATQHLLNKHNIQASKSEAHQKNVTLLNQQIEVANKSFKGNPSRWFPVNLAAFACKNSLAFRAFESNTWKILAQKLLVGNSPSLGSINIRKHYIEHYITIKDYIIQQIADARQSYNLPFLSLSLDLIQNEVQNKKLIGVRVCYIHNGATHSWNLAVRGYNPLPKNW